MTSKKRSRRRARSPGRRKAPTGPRSPSALAYVSIAVGVLGLLGVDEVLPAAARANLWGTLRIALPVSIAVFLLSANLERLHALGRRFGRRLGRFYLDWLSPATLHRDQHRARRENRFYRKLFPQHAELLCLGVREIANAAQLSRLTAWVLLRCPHLIPRPELLDALKALLMLPEDSFSKGVNRGRGYGPACTIERLIYLHRKGLGTLHLRGKEIQTKDDLLSLSPRARADLLRDTETTLDRERTPRRTQR